jgi:hypothetical protein
MARKKIAEPKYYAYYDKDTGEVICVTNEKSTVYSHGIEISYEMHHALVSGEEKFSDYAVGRVKTDDGKTVVAMMPKTDQAYVFKNTMLELITDPPKKDTDLVVTWDLENKQWIFALSDTAKEKNKLGDTRLIFFVTLEEDFNFLIRTMFINNEELVMKAKIAIPFEFDIESKIEKISLATKLTFESYGLITNDN